MLSNLLHFVPQTNYAGPNSFTYSANDGQLDSNVATVTVTISADNDVPVITEGASASVSMSEDGMPDGFALTLHATDLNTMDTLTWSLASDPAHGTANASGTGNALLVGYAPTANYNGMDSFDVQVSDGFGGVDSITINVTIDPVNDAPQLAAIGNKSVPAGTTLTFIASASDIDLPADTLTFSLIGAPAGAAIHAASGVFSWTPSLAQGPAEYTFTIRVTDLGRPGQLG